MVSSPNVVRHTATISRSHREKLNGHRAINLWFTGLSGAGKSTLAHAVEERLHGLACRTYVFDGDNVRHGLCGDLGFEPAERRESLRRIAEMVRLFLEAGVISLTAFISPLEADRAMVKRIIGRENVVEIFCRCPLSICERRDVKGFYRRARAGEIAHYTGISAPYEPPLHPDIEVDTGGMSVDDCVAVILERLQRLGIIHGLQ